jgi:hypothetical protein
MANGARTFIPQILFFARWLKQYVFDHSEPLLKYLGEGGYAVIVLIVDLVIIFAQMVEAVADPTEQWDEFAGIATINSSQLNAIQGAISKFYDSIGVTP